MLPYRDFWNSVCPFLHRRQEGALACALSLGTARGPVATVMEDMLQTLEPFTEEGDPLASITRGGADHQHNNHAGHDRSAVWCINCTHTRRILRQSTAAGPHRRPAHLVCGVHSFAVQIAKPQLGASRGHEVSALGFAIVRKELPGGVLSYAQLGSRRRISPGNWPEVGRAHLVQRGSARAARRTGFGRLGG